MADVAHALIPSLQDDWFLDVSTSHQSPRNITQALRLHGPLNLAALRSSVELVIARRRRRWNLPEETGDAPRDILPIQDFCGWPVNARESEARRYIQQQADGILDLKRGPL